MIVEIERKSRLPLWSGFLGSLILRLLAAAAMGEDKALAVFLSLLSLACAAYFIWGCCLYCKAKGYHPALGLLGLLSLIGLVILAVLPDLHKQEVERKAAMMQHPSIPPPPYRPTEMVQPARESEPPSSRPTNG